MTCAGDKLPKPFPARSLCKSNRSSPARSKNVARNRSDLEPPSVLLLISTGPVVCFDYTDSETRTAPILTLKKRLFTRNSTRKGAGRETGRPRNPKTTTHFARKLVPTASQPGRSDLDVSRG